MDHSQTLHPLTQALRERAYRDALDNTESYIERRWAALPAHVRKIPADDWATFQRLPRDDQQAVFEHHVKRGVLLALDRALHIAEATVPDIDLDLTYDD